jgi:hypothetical protein
VLPVLDSDLQRMPALVKLCHDLGGLPVAEPVEDVAPIAVLQQLRVEPRILRPRPRVRADAWLARSLGQLVVA